MKDAMRESGAQVIGIEPHNTNNEWGFGGMIGTNTNYRLGELTLQHRVGNAHFRHLPSERVDRVYIGGIAKPFDTKFFLKGLAAGLRTIEQFQAYADNWTKGYLAKRR